MIRVGTSGYSYKDWVGHFYPQGTSQKNFLEHYSKHFDTCELNFTYYRIPNARTLSSMVSKSGGRVEFVLKANQEMTHTRKAGEEDYRAFREALMPLIDAGTFGGILAQFPYSFRSSPENGDYLKRLRDRFEGLPIVAEFRNRAWIRDETFALLREQGIGFCCVDEPRLKGLMPSVAEVTSELGYVRFHGRNAAKWWNHERAEQRYDYLYTERELREWLPKIKQIDSRAQKTFVFMNNHFESKAVKNAMMLLDLLEQRGADSSEEADH